ncbi:MAG: hydroxyacylglutathione hydrolase family protein [Candidatus Krumholzibacteriia bacterium]
MIIDHSRDQALVLQLQFGGDRNFQYIVGDGHGDVAVVDPGFAPERIAAVAADRDLAVRRILVTHGHGDHVGGVAALTELTGARVHAGDPARVRGAEPLHDGDEIAVGQLTLRALATPGHAPDHFCLLGPGILFTGDLLFCGKIGGTGPFFAGSSAQQEWDSLQRLLDLPDDTRIFPGHDYWGGEGERRVSTLGHERRHNPFLTVPDFDAFCHLKDTWAEYKQEHGIR